ncbi:hypothetical protein AMST5_02791 [freshwater sediment metagenome]|uniref:Uncharacterized protein n=1 Tax=freshwater sediment metagenome TaxID=556182 RepID=A0AA48RA68_9ZZZZ
MDNTQAPIDRLDELVNRVRILEAAIEGAMVGFGPNDILDHLLNFTGFIAIELASVSGDLSEQIKTLKGAQ